MNNMTRSQLGLRGAIMEEFDPAVSKVVRFPIERRREPLVLAVEQAVRARWGNVVDEPIPGHFLVLLSLLERMEGEQQCWVKGETSEQEVHSGELPRPTLTP